MEESTFFDVEIGSEVTYGGYMKAYKTIKEPINYYRKLSIGKDFQKTNATIWTTDFLDYEVPNRTIYNPKIKKWW